MFLHLGEDITINTKSIIAIFDIDTSSTEKITREFLRKGGKKVVNVNYEIPKSFIVTDDKIYISPISSSTLRKRNKENKQGGNLLGK